MSHFILKTYYYANRKYILYVAIRRIIFIEIFPHTDVDECTMAMALCDTNAICVNIVSSYSCYCDHGYIGNGTSCEGIGV